MSTTTRARTCEVVVDVAQKCIYEREVGNPASGGTLFPYGRRSYRCPYLDGHRETYTDDDARAVAEMVNQSSWLARAQG